MDYSMVGPALALSLSSIGSCIGCGVAGMASHAVMSRTEEGHGKFIGMAAAPSSQSIYGLILMIMMKNALQAGTLSPLAGIGVGAAAGFAFLASAVYQGQCAATGINASAKKPEVYGRCFAALGIIESFALFTFVFSIILMS